MHGLMIAGKYRLNLPLASGGMADVWSATNTLTDRQVASGAVIQAPGVETH